MTLEQHQALPLLPLRNGVFFPGGVISLNVGRQKSIALIKAADPTETMLAIITQKDPEIEEPQEDDLYRVGTLARILKIQKTGRNTYSLMVQGVQRISLERIISDEPYWMAEVTPIIEETDKDDLQVHALDQTLRKVAREVMKLTPELPRGAEKMLSDIKEPGQLADMIASTLDISLEEKMKVLSTFGLKDRLETTLEMLSRIKEVLSVRKEIENHLRDDVAKSQRETILRQQLKAIQKELGEDDYKSSDIETLEKKLEEANLPEEAQEMADRELNRLRAMNPAQAEYMVAKTYLEWLGNLPWTTETEDTLDLDHVTEILNEDHYGLTKIKERIVEYLAVRKLNPEKKGPILCFSGPPGVGKTSLGRSIARALGREFVRMSLGGVRDEAEIRGHRRTYVGALPGRIVQGMRKAGTINPVFLLDEVDKLGVSYRGDPSSALLEVLDPEQNSTFSDHYLEISYDLSNVFFIATANQLDPIQPALRDRMEIIELSGYTWQEKLNIAIDHLLPKQVKDHGLKDDHIELKDEAIKGIIESYTREAGVRQLEREIRTVCRKIAVDVAKGDESTHVVTDENVSDFLGQAKHFPEASERTKLPGVSTGLAWTPTGGDLLFIEATRMPGSGKLNMTGKLGDVMKESTEIALAYIRSNAESLNVAADFNKTYDIHLHVPAGAVPKEGPSAGVAIFSAIVSLLTGRCVRGDVAMTGEITLRGRVLPVGGVKEKVLAAHRAGIKKVLLPHRNQKDLDEVPEEAKNDLEFVFLENMSEILFEVLEAPVATDAGTEIAATPAEA
ncbi:MAG: endopeptidase La [Deltaproteobacteria bacterium]|nr:MAG: endopeptidase La [Deltaproteobacteria bacterium]